MRGPRFILQLTLFAIIQAALITGCGLAGKPRQRRTTEFRTQIAPTPLTPIALPTRLSQTPSPTATITPTSSSTITPTPKPTFTPSPTITPTASQSPLGACPQPDPQWNDPVTFDTDKVPDQLLDFLNKGVPPEKLKAALESLEFHYKDVTLNPEIGLSFKDLTGDGVAELIWHVFIPSEITERYLLVHGCRDIRYEEIYEYALSRGTGLASLNILTIEDINADGVAELAFMDVGYGSGMSSLELIFIVGQGENGIRHLLQPDHIFGMPVAIGGSARKGHTHFEDLDGDRVQELIIRSGGLGGGYSACGAGPLRDSSTIYRWDGMYYTYSREIYDPPIYRFQAAKDGDQAIADGFLESAISSYQRVLFDETLAPGTPHYWLPDQPSFCQEVQIPEADPEERPRLEAYARYRLLTIHAAQNHPNLAQTTYQSLQAQTSSNPAGGAYADLAEAFWGEYQDGNNLEKACQTAVRYARIHEEAVLKPLGTRNYGLYHPAPAPEEICPFPQE